MKDAKERIEVGLVLSGGMGKGAYEVGFSNALVENDNFSIKAISAASVGALNGYALATGKMAQIEHIWKTLDVDDFRQVYDGVLKRCRVYDIIDDVCLESDEMNMPVSTVCWAPPSIKPTYIELSTLDYETRKKFLKASVAVATVMRPVEIDRVKYLDGAIIDNTPVYPMLTRKLDLILVIQFDGYIPRIEPGIASCPILFLNLQGIKKIRDSFDLSRKSVDRMLDFGYRKGRDILSDVSRAYWSSHEEFIELVSKYNSNMKENVLSADYVVRRINRISSRIKY